MRVLIVASEFPPGPGGIGTHAYELARQLHARGWQVTVLAAQDYVDIEQANSFNRQQPFEVARWRRLPLAPLKAFYRWLSLRRWRRRRRAELVIATGERCVWLAPGLGVPWVAIGHGTEFGSSGWAQRLTRRAFSRARAVICVSHYTRGWMLRAGIEPRAEAIIPNGADDQRFGRFPELAVAAADRWQLDGHRVLLTVGHVSERKGQEVVVRALPEVVRQLPDVVYLIVGYPTDRPQLEQLAAELGVAAHLRFAGAVPAEQVVEAMQVADLFVMTSRLTASGDFEGYGIAVVEAALCGLPAVVSAESGLVEAIDHGATGLAVAANDPSATAHAIVSLLAEPGRLEAMGRAARLRAEGEQTWRQRGEQYDRYLRQVLAVEPTA